MKEEWIGMNLELALRNLNCDITIPLISSCITTHRMPVMIYQPAISLGYACLSKTQNAQEKKQTPEPLEPLEKPEYSGVLWRNPASLELAGEGSTQEFLVLILIRV
jgi:hypothetical protein